MGQVAALYKQVKDAPAAKIELVSDDALQIRHHTARVQVHEEPAHAAVRQRRRRVVEHQAHADKVVTASSHHHESERRGFQEAATLFPVEVSKIRAWQVKRLIYFCKGMADHIKETSLKIKCYVLY